MSTTVFGHSVNGRISSSEQLREVAKMPSRYVDSKVIDHIDLLAERFIAASPLAILGTRRRDGGVDQTPRGDPPGFVKVLDPKTLALPDRPGNHRMDAIENMLHDTAVGLIFMIPGHGDTIRVSGQGAVVQDDDLADLLAVNGRPAGLITLIRVERVLCHCPKAFIRSRAWKPDEWPDTSDVPSLAEMMKAHGKMSDTISELEEVIHRSNTERLY
ncbi:MAG: MSMEG_1061 family FMN-dependent PPOX-type flavoprotein [Hyphomicrobiaceae bacterium]